eukprot:TRINITY_DN5310_c1_g3_i3.p1 TRINITY_DN5310_c1_g3~~TRINITY_DN5310_c1_g3_i3.p1  ORF type:complete len:924 (-),score=404.63 TRINITY_DN5310_c1_g3_i3:17-2788(-)
MSFLTEVSSSGGSSSNLEYSPSSGPSGASGGGEAPGYDYHLPHTKTIDLIGEEFAPRKDSPTITTGSSIAIVTSSGGLPVSSTLFLNSNNILTTLAPLSGSSSSSLLQAISGGQVVTLPNCVPSLGAAPVLTGPTAHGELLSSPPVSSEAPPTVITTLPFNGTGLSDVISHTSLSGGHAHGSAGNPGSNGGNPEENGVLLCNLDELSRYIPETFYSDFNIGEAKLDYLESSGGVTKVSGSMPSFTGTLGVSTSSGPVLSTTTTMASPIFSAPGLPTHFSSAPTPITIQLPTQPQPPQGVKTLTYVQNNVAKNSTGLNTTSLQPVKLTTGFAYTATGEKFSIHGLTDPVHHKQNSTVQVQMKPQTLQLTGLDPSKLAVLQELPDVSKVVIQDKTSNLQSSNLNNLLEDMKQQQQPSTEVVGEEAAPTVGYTTAIPVAVSSLAAGGKKQVLMPNKRSRNIIFAGNSLPQGAIPIQINGLNALPISAVKSIPLSIGSLSGATANAGLANTAMVRKNKLDFIKSPISANKQQQIQHQVVTTHNNNNSLKCPLITTSSGSIYSSSSTTSTSSTSGSSPHKTLGGNNKTCTWVFENGEVCGKTFSKSYNLVVHMRMHEDVRPFCCSLCDQTFRQKAHLQRHETTHGIGVKVSRNSSAAASSSSNLKKRKKKVVLAGNINSQHAGVATSNLQKRLSRVDEKFALKSSSSSAELVKTTTAKFSSAEIDEAIKAAVEGSNLAPGLLSLKREPSQEDEEDLSERPPSKIPHMSVKVEPSEDSKASSSNPSSHLNSQALAVSSSSNNNINIISSSNSSNSQHSHSSSSISSSSTPITAQFVQHPGSTTIVIDNLEDHSPEIQKEILNALLSDHASGTSLFTIQQQHHHHHHTDKASEVVIEDSGTPQSYPPVTVQEFLQENSGAHILVENSQNE